MRDFDQIEPVAHHEKPFVQLIALSHSFAQQIKPVIAIRFATQNTTIERQNLDSLFIRDFRLSKRLTATGRPCQAPCRPSSTASKICFRSCVHPVLFRTIAYPANQSSIPFHHAHSGMFVRHKRVNIVRQFSAALPRVLFEPLPCAMC